MVTKSTESSRPTSSATAANTASGDSPRATSVATRRSAACSSARLEKLGAERVQQAHFWQVMRDPAGLLFCVIPESLGTLNDSNAQRWD